jgi:transposase
MAKPVLSDQLWEFIKPLLPIEPPKPKGGRPRIPDRQTLTGILFVLRTGISWEYFPKEMGCGSGMTCWRRLKDWHNAGVWEKVHRTLLDRLGKSEQIDWSRAVIDGSSIRAVFGGRKPDQTPQIEPNLALNAI